MFHLSCSTQPNLGDHAYPDCRHMAAAALNMPHFEAQKSLWHQHECYCHNLDGSKTQATGANGERFCHRCFTQLVQVSVRTMPF